jgi:hypothetical protein
LGTGVHAIADSSFEGTRGKYLLERAGLLARIYDSWGDMRASTRRLLDERPTEGRILFFLVISDMIFFLSWTMKTVVSPATGAKEYIPLEIAFWMIGALMIRTFVLYLFSGVVHLVCKFSPSSDATWQHTRAGMFWGSVVAAPFGFASALLTVGLKSAELSFPFLRVEWLVWLIYYCAMVPYVYYIAAGIAETHKFKSLWPILSVITVLAFGFVAVILWAQTSAV